MGTDREAYVAISTGPALDALVVDINLGAGTTGFDVARFARRAVADLPVVYVTGQVSPESLSAFGVPVAAFVWKPFTAEDILEPLRARVRRSPRIPCCSCPQHWRRPMSGRATTFSAEICGYG